MRFIFRCIRFHKSVTTKALNFLPICKFVKMPIRYLVFTHRWNVLFFCFCFPFQGLEPVQPEPCCPLWSPSKYSARSYLKTSIQLNRSKELGLKRHSVF